MRVTEAAARAECRAEALAVRSGTRVLASLRPQGLEVMPHAPHPHDDPPGAQMKTSYWEISPFI